jgi:CheY-like chemotaxis protein
VRWRAEVAEFEVIDTGIGIAPEDLDRIFEPLQRVKGGQAPGLGLGLTITRVLTEIMGGEISVTSTPGVGSRFRVRMLLSQSARDAPAARIENRVTGYEGPRRTIVVADDDADHRALMEGLLAPLGFTVRTAPDGLACLDIAQRFPADLYLIDLAMPAPSGWALARALRQLQPSVPIIIISADGRELKQPPEGAVHHDDTLTKPVSLVAVLERIGRLLHLSWTSPAPDAAPTATNQPLAPEQLDTLRELAAIGYVSGLRTQLDQFERDSPGNALFADLRALLAEYRLDAFLHALDRASTTPAKAAE